MKTALCVEQLHQDNRTFAGTGGVSEGNRSVGFQPAFHDRRTGQTELARFADGRPAPCHLLDGVPREWIALRDPRGQVERLKRGIVAGFLRGGRFYTREQAAQVLAG